MVRTKIEVIELMQANREKIKAMGVSRLGLFGSFVRNEANDDSDIDILVEFNPDAYKFRNLIDLNDFLENLYQRKVDVLTPNGLSKYFGHKILNSTEYVM